MKLEPSRQAHKCGPDFIDKGPYTAHAHINKGVYSLHGHSFVL